MYYVALKHTSTQQLTTDSPGTMVNELPATNWLGYSLDMLQTTPMDIKAVSLS